MTEESKAIEPGFSFRRHAWKQLKRNKPALWSFYLLLFLGFLSLLAPILATDLPWYVSVGGESYYPAFSDETYYTFQTEDGSQKLERERMDWKRLKTESIWWAPIPYSAATTERRNGYLNSGTGPGEEQLFLTRDGETNPIPTRFRHWLGTNEQGEDVLAGLLHGTRTAFTIGIGAMAIATLIGLLLGLAAGYWGDHRFNLSRGELILSLPGLFFGWYYGFHFRIYALQDAWANPSLGLLVQLLWSLVIFGLVVYLFLFLGRFLSRLPGFESRHTLPVDTIVIRGIEIFQSIPRLVLIFGLIALLEERTVFSLILIIGFSSWVTIARFTRAEMLKVREMDYMEAGKALGLPSWRLMIRHALPNSLAPALVAVAFGVASAILVESGLSFLNLGPSGETVTWGTLLRAGQQNFTSWWLVIFPGLAIFITVLAYNLLGEALRDALDPRLKS